MKTTLRIASILVLFGAGSSACSNTGATPDNTSAEGRGDVVTATSKTTNSGKPTAGGTGSAPIAKTSAPDPHSTAPVDTGTNPNHPALCDKKVERAVPDVKLDHLEIGDAKALEPKFQTGDGWTWINAWAGYCGPCREEIPRIQSFVKRLNAGGAKVKVQFVSFDDDPREARKFMETGALSQSLYVAETDHTKFLSDLGLKGNVALPIQIFVGPSGKVNCVASGAIEDSDYGEISHLVGAK